MEIIIKAEPKEIAALIKEMSKQQPTEIQLKGVPDKLSVESIVEYCSGKTRIKTSKEAITINARS